MRLTFTKRTGKYDDLLIENEGRAAEALRCPKQRIIPHDMVHFAVESFVRHRGFLGLVADGARAAFTTMRSDPEEAVERLVEVCQAEMWGERVPVADFLAAYEHACAARGHAAAPVAPQDVAAIRERLDELTAEWSAVAVNAALTMEM